MKKLLVFLLLFSVCHANEMTDDYMDIAAGYALNGKYTDAINYIDKVLKIEPENKQAKKIKTDLERIINPAPVSDYDVQKEFTALIAILNANPDNAAANYQLAEIYRQNCNMQAAAARYQKAVKSLPQAYLGMAECNLVLKDYPAALAAINSYLKIYPKSDFALAYRARINLAQAKCQVAQTDITAALALNDDLSYKFLEGKILFASGNYRMAKRKLEPLTKEIQTSEIYKYLGLCDYAMQNYTAALLSLDKAIILGDSGLETTYNEVLEKVK
jgi:tetratricopeptide (TPR) repeat protein